MVEDRVALLSTLDTRTKVLGLFLLVVEVLFGITALTALPKEQVWMAVVVAGAVLVCFVVAIAIIEVQTARAQQEAGRVEASPLTPYDKIMNDIVRSTLETICRAVSLPQTPESANLRVFIFRKEDEWLVCRYYWAPNPVGEEVGRLRFPINIKSAEEAAIVRCVLEGTITRTTVDTLSLPLEHQAGEVDPNLRFVLAAPIVTPNGDAWGTVDFDTSTETGEVLLSTDVSKSAIYQLARHLQVIIFAFPPPEEEVRSLESSIRR